MGGSNLADCFWHCDDKRVVREWCLKMELVVSILNVNLEEKYSLRIFRFQLCEDHSFTFAIVLVFFGHDKNEDNGLIAFVFDGVPEKEINRTGADSFMKEVENNILREFGGFELPKSDAECWKLN